MTSAIRTQTCSTVLITFDLAMTDPTQPYQSIMWVLIAAISVLLVAFILSMASMRRRQPLVWGWPGRTKYRTSAVEASVTPPSPPALAQQHEPSSPTPVYHIHQQHPSSSAASSSSRYYFSRNPSLPSPALSSFGSRSRHHPFRQEGRCTTRGLFLPRMFQQPVAVQRCDTVKAGRTCWFQLEEEERRARLRRLMPGSHQHDPQRRLAAVLHSSLGTLRTNGQQAVRRRRLSHQASQSQPDLSRSMDGDSEFIFTALWWLNEVCFQRTSFFMYCDVSNFLFFFSPVVFFEISSSAVLFL